MPLVPIPTNSVLQAVFRATIAGNDPLTNPLENVQWLNYQSGLTPNPAGVTIAQMAFRLLQRWATVWGVFQADDCNFFSCTLRAVAGFTPKPPNRFLSILGQQWTDNTPQPVGSVISPSLPSFNAFAIRKITALPGRGKQGQIRIPGVPKTSTQDNLVDPVVLAALDAFLVPGSLDMNVSTGFSDTCRPVIINGKLINANPGHTPDFYQEFIDGFTASSEVSTQITRKSGRRRT